MVSDMKYKQEWEGIKRFRYKLRLRTKQYYIVKLMKIQIKLRFRPENVVLRSEK